MATPRHDMTRVAMRRQFIHVGVHMDHGCLGPFAHGPMHGVAFVETGAEDDEAVEVAFENGFGGMAGSRVAEDAEGQFMILRKDALRT